MWVQSHPTNDQKICFFNAKKKIYLQHKSNIKQNITKLSQGTQKISRNRFAKGSGYFASRGKIATCYFDLWRQNTPNGYFAASAKIALSLMLTQTLTLIPTLALTQTEEKHYVASGGKIATSFVKPYQIGKNVSCVENIFSCLFFCVN